MNTGEVTRHIHHALASVGLLFALVPWSVHGQVDAQLTPPVAQGGTDVPYPADATGVADVVLDVTVDEHGGVSQVEVIEGAAPFAEQARSAALAWQFIPAQRAGVPVAAKIRARVEFRPPAAPSPAASPLGVSPTAAATPVPPVAAVPAAAAALDVTIRGHRNEIGQTTLSAGEVRALPGAFGDPFRAIEALPGVTPAVSGFPYFYVRGAPPNNNGYFIDGIRVPLLFHVGLGQSVIHPGLIERIDFFPTNAPASFGRVAGGLIAGQTREPASTWHGEANLRLVDAGALIEVPFAGDRGSVLVAGRYGYPGPILGAITSDVKLDYWDYQARASWRAGERDTLSLFAFGSHDYLAAATVSTSMGSGAPRSSLVEQFVSDFHRIDLRYDHALQDGLVRVAASAGYDRQGAAPTYLSDRSAAVRIELDQKAAPNLRLRAGADARFDDYDFEQRVPQRFEPDVPSSANPAPINLSGGVHADLVWRVGPRLTLVPGARVDMFQSTRTRMPGANDKHTSTLPAFDPRVSARVTIAPAVIAVSSVGLSHQYPVLRVGDVPPPVVNGAGFPFGRRQLQSAFQASQGFELALPAEIVVTATGFFSQWWGLTDLTASCLQIMPPIVPPNTTGEPRPEADYMCPSNQPVTGRAYGFELLARRALTQRLSGILSYTLSRSTRKAHFVTLDGGDAEATVASEFDRTHVLSGALSYDLGAGWRAGGRLVFYTGSPYSELAGNVPVPPYNNRRTPAFIRLDVRLEKRWHIGANGSIALVLEGQNVTLSREVTSLGLDCMGELSPAGGTNQCTHGKVGPITIPSLGVEATF